MDSINRTLEPGTYYVQVFDVAGGQLITVHCAVRPNVVINVDQGRRHVEVSRQRIGSRTAPLPRLQRFKLEIRQVQLGYGEGDEATAVKFGPYARAANT